MPPSPPALLRRLCYAAMPLFHIPYPPFFSIIDGVNRVFIVQFKSRKKIFLLTDFYVKSCSSFAVTITRFEGMEWKWWGKEKEETFLWLFLRFFCLFFVSFRFWQWQFFAVAIFSLIRSLCVLHSLHYVYPFFSTACCCCCHCTVDWEYEVTRRPWK